MLDVGVQSLKTWAEGDLRVAAKPAYAGSGGYVQGGGGISGGMGMGANIGVSSL